MYYLSLISDFLSALFHRADFHEHSFVCLDLFRAAYGTEVFLGQDRVNHIPHTAEGLFGDVQSFLPVGQDSLEAAAGHETGEGAVNLACRGGRTVNGGKGTDDIPVQFFFRQVGFPEIPAGAAVYRIRFCQLGVTVGVEVHGRIVKSAAAAVGAA